MPVFTELRANNGSALSEGSIFYVQTDLTSIKIQFIKMTRSLTQLWFEFSIIKELDKLRYQIIQIKFLNQIEDLKIKKKLQSGDLLACINLGWSKQQSYLRLWDCCSSRSFLLPSLQVLKVLYIHMKISHHD